MARLTDRQIAGLAAMIPWEGQDLRIGVALALAESGGNTTITNRNSNGSIDTGVWQINSVHGTSVEDLKDPVVNAQMAGRIKAEQGWTAWSAYDNGRYRQFLERAGRAAANPDREWAAAQAAAGHVSTFGGGVDLPDIPVVDDVMGAIMAFVDTVVDTVNKLIEWVGDPHNWARIAWVVGGAGVVFVSARVFMEPVIKPIEQKITGAATAVATKGASATAPKKAPASSNGASS